jgi:putative addiction module killer protein
MQDIRKVRFYKTLSGKELFNDWYNSLKDKRARLQVAGKLRQLQNSSFKNYSSVGNEVFEIRIFLGPGYRVYFGFESEIIIVVLLAGDKSSQAKDIKKATKLWRDFLNANNRI